MKKVTRFRAGKKGQHESLLKRTSWGPEGPQTSEEKEAFSSNPHTIEERIEAIRSWLYRAMDTCGLPEGTKVTRNNAKELNAAILSPAMNARYYIKLADEFRKEEKYDSAFNALLFSIPALLTTQVLVYEDLILAGNSKTSSASIEKQKYKENKIKLATPFFLDKYQKIRSKSQVSKLTAQWLKDEHGIEVAPETVRGWFKKK